MTTAEQRTYPVPAVAVPRLPAPTYIPPGDAAARPRLGLAVESMRRHTSDEGWQLFAALAATDYRLCGYGLATEAAHPGGGTTYLPNLTDVYDILQKMNPAAVVIQDKREWEGKTAAADAGLFDGRERFLNVGALGERPDVFKATVLKDAHQSVVYHADAAREIGCHAWVCYYHPGTVARLAPYTRPEHLVRTYHTVDAALVPAYTPEGRRGCLLSGALGGGAYPLRRALVANLHLLPNTSYKPHPGYGRRGCVTPEYLKTLGRYKVAICTSSVYGYALRKIMEATACGCVVVTDLPAEDALPAIDSNLYRVDPGTHPHTVGNIVAELEAQYDAEKQRHYAAEAVKYYDYRTMGKRLVADLEALRRKYNDSAG